MMYWLYLIFFIIAVFTPDLVRRDYVFLSEERTEELIIFVLGATAFLIFIATEKKWKINLKEKNKIQKEASLATKDLTDTYSYIGEVNRKLDILKDITLGIAKEETLNDEKEADLYKSILHAVHIFAKSDNASLKFINIKKKAVIKETGKNKKARCAVISEMMTGSGKSFLDVGGFFYVRSLKPINNIIACIAIAKKNSQQKLEDQEMIKMLATQALYVYNFRQKVR